ncbi:VanZ domain-containing protein [Madurella fahalii]|uniref:VanZ domain-containing protein n=1 Tax=Madurella fahalii TaxID=1157608 RepID=A0ABQ0GIG4_9PEZI
MRIRLPFAGVFALLLLLAGYAGLSTLQVDAVVNDKVLHFVTFFALTLAFYWVVDTSRRRTLNLTLTVCTLGLGVGSEFVQALLPNGREFDILDVVANIVGSLVGLGLCSWYHKRMLERKRLRKYTAVPAAGDVGEEDLELGEGPGLSGGGVSGDQHEEGVVGSSAAVSNGQRATTLEEEVDNWDENAVDVWDEDELGDVGVSVPTTSDANGDPGKKRSD